MAHHSTIRAHSQPDIMHDLKFFIGGTTKKIKCSPLELTKTAVSLLKVLPATRSAVLEYFCSVFNNATQNYIIRIETEIATGQLPPVEEDDESVVAEIHAVLCSFVSTNAEAWAPIISTWSLELLGELSSRYAGRAHVSSGVNETLQLWMSCRATRTLIDITTQCLSCLIHSNTEACINALLDTSVKHSPHFDWVVAHVGSCFPTTVITRVLSCGLKDFCQNKSYEQGCDSPKLKSVVGILGHLAGSHCEDIRTALLDLFNWSLHPHAFQDGEVLKSQKKATVPFLLQLAFLSPTLFSAVCRDIHKTLSLQVIAQLYNFTNDWCKYFGSSEALKDLVVNLIMKCEVGGVQIINLLLDCIFASESSFMEESICQTIKENVREVLEYVLQEIDVLLRTQNNTPINILDCFVRECADINAMLLSNEKIKSETASRIIIFIGHSNQSLLIKSVSSLFENSETDESLALLVRILTSELIDKRSQPYTEKGGHFAVVLEQLLNRHEHNSAANKDKAREGLNSLKMWENLLKLLKWEKSNKVLALKSNIISRAIYANLVSISLLFGSDKFDTKILHCISKILDIFYVPSITQVQMYVSVQAILNFTTATVNYFFVCCHESDEIIKLSGCTRSFDLLKKLALYSKPAQVLALRELLERSLFTNDGILFGGKSSKSFKNSCKDKLLLEQNRKNNKTIPVTKNSSLLSGGVIGNGKSKTYDFDLLSPEAEIANTELLIRAIKSCCMLPPESENKNINVSLDSLTLVSLLLVQFVSPDVMYNGLPWPEEEFCKVTIERDFYIRRLFNSTPLLWDLLSLMAVYRPTLCYCSVLIRALIASLIHQWSSMGDQGTAVDTGKYKNVMDTTVKVIGVMALGQLIPPPLSNIRDVVPFLKCVEIVQILRDCVWNYMRDHVPSPALFSCDTTGVHWRDPTVARPEEIYTNTLRIIMQRNIKTVGHLYSQMFINVPQAE